MQGFCPSAFARQPQIRFFSRFFAALRGACPRWASADWTTGMIRESQIQRIEERLRHKKSCTIFEHDLSRIWPRDERDQLKREKEIHAFAAANGWLATILDPGIRVTFKKI
jgi:hypothetical protein